MIWNFAEANPFSESTGNFCGAVHWIVKLIEISSYVAQAKQYNEMQHIILMILFSRLFLPIRLTMIISAMLISQTSSISGCVALSSSIYPDLFATMLVPKVRS